MAAPRKYPPPHEQLYRLAVDALESGLSFDQFWDLALLPGAPAVTWAMPEERRPLGAVVWPRDTFDRAVSLAATRAARDGWRRAYTGAAPTRHERALRRLAPIFGAMVDVVEAPVLDAESDRERVAA